MKIPNTTKNGVVAFFIRVILLGVSAYFSYYPSGIATYYIEDIFHLSYKCPATAYCLPTTRDILILLVIFLFITNFIFQIFNYFFNWIIRPKK